MIKIIIIWMVIMNYIFGEYNNGFEMGGGYGLNEVASFQFLRGGSFTLDLTHVQNLAANSSDASAQVYFVMAHSAMYSALQVQSVDRTCASAAAGGSLGLLTVPFVQQLTVDKSYISLSNTYYFLVLSCSLVPFTIGASYHFENPPLSNELPYGFLP